MKWGDLGICCSLLESRGGSSLQLLSYKNIIASFLNFTGHEVSRWVKKHPMKTMNDPDEVVSCTSVTEVLTSSDFFPWKLCQIWIWTSASPIITLFSFCFLYCHQRGQTVSPCAMRPHSCLSPDIHTFDSDCQQGL